MNHGAMGSPCLRVEEDRQGSRGWGSNVAGVQPIVTDLALMDRVLIPPFVVQEVFHERESRQEI